MDIPSFEDIFRQIKTGLWLAGLTFNVPRIQFRFYILLASLTLMALEEVLFLVSRYAPENLLELTQLGPCICSGILAIIKIILIAAKKQKIFNLTERLAGLYRTIQSNPKKRAIVAKEVIVVKFLIKYFFALNLVLSSVYNFSALIFMLYNYIKINKVEFNLPFAVIVPFSTKSWPTWFIVYAHSVLCAYTCILFYTTVDALYYILTSQICNNLAIICAEIRQLDETNVALLRDLAMNHQYILKLAEDLEEIFKMPNLFNVLVGSLEICALGFNLTVGEVAQIPGCALFLGSVLFHVLMMSAFGEKLIGVSSKVVDAAFCSKWYAMDRKSKKTIFIMMIRSNKQTQLTAYNFSVISFASFTKIISTSWSYFTILRTVYTPPESTYVK